MDENGLGPLLGPLVVTCAWILSGAYEPDRIREALAGPFDVRDSKKVFRQQSLGRGEVAALSLVRAMTGGRHATAGAFLDALAGPRPAGLPCGHGPDPCSVDGIDLPIWAPPEAVESRSERLAAALEADGMSSSGISAAILCPWLLNRRLDGEISKLDVDLDLFLKVAHTVRSRWPGPGTFTCGKIGARSRYSDWFPGASTVMESRERSTYIVPELGTVHFLLDADDADPLVSMASIVGKYAREILMEAIHRSVSRLAPGLRRPSGYRDRVTAEFLAAAAGAIASAGIPSDCITRKR